MSAMVGKSREQFEFSPKAQEYYDNFMNLVFAQIWLQN
jgi:hypothetical protein